jgi:UDP-glucose 4-epimerase
MLAQNGNDIVVFDNLSTGHQEAVKWGKLVVGDVLSRYQLYSIFTESGPFDLVFHFCAKSLVGESVAKPQEYYRNNVEGTLNVLDTMLETDHDKLVFSSTAAVYGQPQSDIIDELQPLRPINPYGHSKKMVEDILGSYYKAYGIRSVSLRYFNACGADPDSEVGEKHNPETHLIPNVLRSVINTNQSSLKVFGDKFPTHDGTCIRDYIHVNDLSSAHLLAGEYLNEHSGAHVFNLGNGKGFSVKEIISAAEEVVEKKIPYTIEEPRDGDPAILVADAALAKSTLGWEPKYTDIKDIIETAWKWHKKETF